MKPLLTWPLRIVTLLLLSGVLAGGPASADGGYFILGYGPYAHQMAGASTAVGLDGFGGASNPGKGFDTGNRIDLGLLVFMPYRRIERHGASDPDFNISSTSHNGIFFLPEAGYVHRINQHLAWGVTLYGNGGLNTAYEGNTGVAKTNLNPTQCGTQPSNFFFGCGKLGIDLNQLIAAPSLSWKITATQSVGIAPLIAYQRIRVYGFQAFVPVSEHPDDVTNNGYDQAFGAGVRVGWYGHITPWLDLGAAYASPIYMQKFTRYDGFFAGEGRFDIPENYSIGAAIKPAERWVLAIDVQQISYHEVPALGNSGLNTITNPTGDSLGSHGGSALNWRNQINYRLGIQYAATHRLTLRSGFSYGLQPGAENQGSSLNMFAPNPRANVTVGLTWALSLRDEFNFAYGRYLMGNLTVPSTFATFPGIGANAVETVKPHVDTVWLAWSRHL